MKHFEFFLLTLMLIAILTLAGCSNDEPDVVKDNQLVFTVNGVSFTMVKVEGGTFMMGAQGSYEIEYEKPVHEVTLTNNYYIGQTEVTQALWQTVMGNNPSFFNEGDYGTNLKRPVEEVSWNDCQVFISKLNELTGKTFRLPTEAEWEYAARGGNKSQGYKYAGSNTIEDVVWYYRNAYYVNSIGTTHTVATKAPNELGLYDMSGNVWEWCQDWYRIYNSSPSVNPAGPTSGDSRVYRGGSCIEYDWNCRVLSRSGLNPEFSSGYLGLRLAL